MRRGVLQTCPGVHGEYALPDAFRGLIRTAVDAYRGSYVHPPLEASQLEHFAEYAREEIAARRDE